MEIQTNINTSVTKEKKVKKAAGTTDSAADGQGKDVMDTADYKLNSAGKKYKAHRIIFNKGVDDGKKGVSEHMELQEKEMTDAQMKKREEIVKGMKKSYKDFKSRYGANAKSVMYATATKQAMKEDLEIEEEIQEELKGNQHKLDKNKNGKLDAEDFKKLRKEEQEIEEGTGNLKPGWMLKKDPELAKKLKDKIDLAKKRQATYGDKSAGKSMKEENDMQESVFDWKNKPRETSDKSSTMTKHDVKKTSTGTVYTKQRDADGMSKEFKRDNSAPMKRGRGRPKKSSFGEAAEFLMGLDEATFDSLMEEGFDAFAEQFEKLDELSKATLASYASNAAYDAKFKGHQAGFSQGHAMAKSKEMFGGVEAGAEQDDKAHKRLKGVAKAIKRLAK